MHYMYISETANEQKEKIQITLVNILVFMFSSQMSMCLCGAAFYIFFKKGINGKIE